MSFDPINGFQTVAEFFASGAGVFLLTHAAKKINAIPVFQGQTGRIRAVAGVLSAVSVVLVSLADSRVGAEDLSSLITAVLGFVMTWGTAHTVHKTITSEKK